MRNNFRDLSPHACAARTRARVIARGYTRARGVRLLWALPLVLVASCGGEDRGRPDYGYAYPDAESRDAAAAWIQETVRAANPMSDEEPEDNIAQAAREAGRLYKAYVPGLKFGYSKKHRFVPLQDCTPEDRLRVEAWIGGAR